MSQPEQKIIQDLERQISILEEQVNTLIRLRQQDREEQTRGEGPLNQPREMTQESMSEWLDNNR